MANTERPSTGGTSRPVSPNRPNIPSRTQESAGRQKTAAADDSETVVGRGNSFVGDIAGQGDIEIRGSFKGSIKLEANRVKVAKTGTVEATIDAKNVEVYGQVEGDVKAGELVSIRRDSVVAGDINAPRVFLEDGSHFKGSIEMANTSGTNPSPGATRKSEPAESSSTPEKVDLSETKGEPPPGSTSS